MRARGLVLVLLACACGSPPPSAVTVALGTVDLRQYGDTRWVDLTPGRAVELAPGAQGGFHLWLHYRVTGAVGEFAVQRQVDRLGDNGARARVLTTEFRQTFLAGEVFTTPNPVPSFMCPTPIGVDIRGATAELTLRLATTDGVTVAQAQTTFVPSCPPAGDPQRDFCQSICSGAP